MIQTILSPYLPSYVSTLVYMLQNTEYQPLPYLTWYWRTQNFGHVMRRRRLVPTRAARLLMLVLAIGMLLQICLGLFMIYLWYRYSYAGDWAFGLALLVSYPIVWAHLIVVPLVLGRLLIIHPLEVRAVVQSERIFRQHPAMRLAITGSYGKTSMKELLLTVLSAGKTVAATPANKNVATSHAAFARSLTGREDILLIEYGEGAPGDVARFARTTHPTHAVITGVAAAHLDRYKTVDAAGKDIFSVANALADKHQVYVNGESPAAAPFLQPEFNTYDQHGALGWKVSSVRVSLAGLDFTLKKGKRALGLTSHLLGRHQLGPLSLAAALAAEFGIDEQAIIAGVAKTVPFEHRMQPYQLNGGWVIDDTYNGNIEGVRAGTALLKELAAKRKLYVTPGLVGQGKETAAIHEEMGRLIADSTANVVVLMRNSVTDAIRQGLEAAGFTGEVRIETNPLEFYTSLGHFIAAGDVVLMQNDWPDNYA